METEMKILYLYRVLYSNWINLFLIHSISSHFAEVYEVIIQPQTQYFYNSW